MSEKSLFDKLKEDKEYSIVLEEEKAILDATELVFKLMEDEGITKSALAERLGRSKPYVSQLLAGNRNMTIRTFTDMLFCMGFRISFSADKLSDEKKRISNLKRA